jgi:uncharacterized phage infection (PIP) family protein YhgE
MPKNINSASRLHSLLEQVLSEPDSTQVLEVWAKLFAINESNVNLKAALVSEHLRWMYRELDLISNQMQKLNYSENLYTSAISNIEYAISAMILPTTWNVAKQYIRPEYLKSLEFCSEILPDEESQISQDELDNIQELIIDLRSSLSNSTLPPRLLALIKHHIELIERALAEYPISGAIALREAARTGLGEIIEIKDEVSASQDAPEISKLGELWNTVNKYADAALKIEGIAQLANTIKTLLGG